MKRIALLFAGLTACAGLVFPEGSTTIKWSQFQVEVAEQVKAMAKRYSDEHPGVTIDASVLGDPYWDQLKVRAASLDMPDIFMTDGYTRIASYRNYILNLDGDKLTNSIVDGAKSAISLDGKVVGLPVQMSAWGVIYNKALFAKAGVAVPATYNELVAACAALKAKGITPFVN